MGETEELPNEGIHSVPYSSSTLNVSSSIQTPEMPPNLTSAKNASIEEVAADLKRTPFFMTTLPDDSSADDNAELAAMQALLYEGTRAEIASGFRESGNEMAKARKWTDGKELYTKALMALKVESKEGEADETQREHDLEIVCLINRALCNLELKNFRSCTLDCQAALLIAPTNVKAYYRFSLALYSLSKFDSAIEACRTGLSYDPQNSALITLQQKITDRQAVLVAAEQKRLQREILLKQEKEMLNSAIKLRMIRTRTTGQPPEMEDADIRLVPDPLSPASTLTFPVVLLYPLHLQSDFVKAFGEEQTPIGHLKYLLPLPWDEKKEYTLEGVETYMETREGGLIKWGKKVPLLKVLSCGKVEVVDGIVRVNVVPKTRASEWIESVKKRKLSK